MAYQDSSHVADNYASVCAAVQLAAQRAERDAEEVTIVAVCKRQLWERVMAAYRAGVRDFGESTAQGLRDKCRAFENEGIDDVRWHFVGRLQRNKVKTVASVCHRIHSVDRLSLADALDHNAGALGSVNVLLQVNTGDEAQKGGVRIADVGMVADAVALHSGLCLRGLMAIPPRDADPWEHFCQLAEIGQRLRETPGFESAVELSMGMSSDFELAVECGATHLRVGTALFGERSS